MRSSIRDRCVNGMCSFSYEVHAVKGRQRKERQKNRELGEYYETFLVVAVFENCNICTSSFVKGRILLFTGVGVSFYGFIVEDSTTVPHL